MMKSVGVFNFTEFKMEKEDILLGVEMERLEIQPVKLNINRCGINPFTNNDLKNNIVHESRVIQRETKCDCNTLRKTNNNSGINKNKHNKILKEPILRILKTCGNLTAVEDIDESPKYLNKNVTNKEKLDPLNLCTLVRNCNQLKISTKTNEQRCMPASKSNNNKWWKQDTHCAQEHKESRQQSSQPGSCSQQALNPPCDVTIDELASYFETLVHIPKKMSSMAEMMYI